MPTIDYFKSCPDFPSDVPIADIPVIPLKDLENNSEESSNELFQSCLKHGGFLLNLQGSENGEKLLKVAESMFELSKDVFSLDSDELLKYKWNPPRHLRGYKPAGAFKTEGDKVDSIQVYSLDQVDILSVSPPLNLDPQPFVNHKKETERFVHHAHNVSLSVLAHIDKHLGLAPGTLGTYCPLDKPSASCVRLLLKTPSPFPEEPSEVTLAGHTDISLITLLFNVISGLQVLPTGKENIPSNWRYLKPQPGCVLFQIGDSLVQLTGGAVPSIIHRVVPAVGKQASVIRRSLAYFIRVENGAPMRRLKGKGIPKLAEGEEDEERSPLVWADERVKLVIKGKLEPWTKDSAKEATKLNGNE